MTCTARRPSGEQEANGQRRQQPTESGGQIGDAQQHYTSGNAAGCLFVHNVRESEDTGHIGIISDKDDQTTRELVSRIGYDCGIYADGGIGLA
jgi:hypothetical protein